MGTYPGSLAIMYNRFFTPSRGLLISWATAADNRPTLATFSLWTRARSARFRRNVVFGRRDGEREINDVSDGGCAEEARRFLDFLHVFTQHAQWKGPQAFRAG